MSKSIQQPGNIIDPENSHDNPEEGVQEERRKIDDTLAQGGSAATHQGVIETVGADNLDPTNAPQLDQEVFDFALRCEKTLLKDIITCAARLGVERVVNAIISSPTGDITVVEHFCILAVEMLKYCNKTYTSVIFSKPLPEHNLTYEQMTQLLDYLIEHQVCSAYMSICFPGEHLAELGEKAIAAVIEQRDWRGAGSVLGLVEERGYLRLTEEQEKALKALDAK